MSQSEKIIRSLYEITSDHERGFARQVRDLLQMGCERFQLEIGILANIVGNQYHVVHQVSPESVPLADAVDFNLPETYCAMTMEAMGPVAHHHVAESEVSNHPAYEAFALESYIGIPLRVDGEPYGTLNFSSPFPRPRHFSDIDIDALKLMATWLEGEISRMQYQQMILRQKEELALKNKVLQQLTETDVLTQVGNRAMFYEKLVTHLHLGNRAQVPLSVIMFDIDYFKQYNDNHGHIAGDNALKHVARIISELTRMSDYLARYGGEEFIIMLPNTDADNAVETAERYRKAIADIDSLDRPVTCSFGISTYYPEGMIVDTDALSERLTDEADQALYHSKHQGRNCVHHFDCIAAKTAPSAATQSSASVN